MLCLLFVFMFIWEKNKKPPQLGEDFGGKNKTERMHNRGTCGPEKKFGLQKLEKKTP
jgi:hypothetical protein